MNNEEIETLIEDMIAVKAAHPILAIPEVLKIFEIQATKDLATEIKILRNKL